MGKTFTLSNVLCVNAKRSHGSLCDTLAWSRVFLFPNTLETPRNEADKFPRPTQTQAQRYKSALDHSVTQHDSRALSTLHLCLRLSCSRLHAWKANASRNVSVDARNGRSVLRQPLKVKMPLYLPKARKTILRIVLLLRLLSFGVPSLLVQRKRLFCKIQGEDQVVHTISVNRYKFSPFLVYRVRDLFLAALVLDINIFLCNLIS